MSGTWVEVIKNPQQKSELWQWDTGRQIIIKPEENAIVDEVHFANAYSKDALVVVPQVNEQGSIVADIPNILLWQVFSINVYVVMKFPNGKGTIYEEQLKINPRKKPSDYVYTETEILNYLDLEKRIKNLEDGGSVNDEQIKKVVYEALTEAKESGEFDGKDGYTPIKGVDYFDGKDGLNGRDGVDGKDGINGKDGADGYTPVKGMDYFTDTDKVEMVSAVISALPVYDGEVVSI